MPIVASGSGDDGGEKNMGVVVCMNAWDPHSVVGNGNSIDDSLDGFFGRYSAMAYLCSPKVNPHINFEQLVRMN